MAGLHEATGPDDLPEAMVTKMRGQGLRRTVFGGADRLARHASNVEVWEQVASASCTGYAMVLAATGLGYGAVWKSAAVLGTTPVRQLFDVGPDETLLGWVNIGTPAPFGARGRRRPGRTVAGRVLRLDA